VERSRVAVALSGGVDSSTAAALLVEAGREVIGFTLKLWEGSRCCSLSDAEDARRVARQLRIPFYVLDARAEFEAEVIGPFLAEYGRGRTPNPCILCNRKLKFGSLLRRASDLGCEALATGHYARLSSSDGVLRLRKARDPRKDQSYFLVPETPEGLARVLFPLGELTKEEVRAHAAAFGLPVSRKPESQDVCFVPQGDLPRFLEQHLGRSPGGEVIDLRGRVVGTHGGATAYTVGQRKGLGISGPEPLYVLGKDAAANRLVVGPRSELLAGGFEARGPVWLSAPPARAFGCHVKIRSTAREAACTVEREGESVRVHFEEPQFGVAPGQMAVFYDGDLVLGGAWMEAGWKPGRAERQEAETVALHG
jgi:tRNA-uridine 2-sulfurtransferase